jgi:ParB family transcriptional regulator, chromosome partitioning protein
MARTTSKQKNQPIGDLIDIDLVQLPSRGQPRRSFNAEKLEQLTASIKVYGILEPLIVRETDNGCYELVAGERRLRAAKAAGLTEIPVIIRHFTNEQAIEIALLENLQRDDLNPIDETEGILDLLEQTLHCSKDKVVSLLNQAANSKRRNQELNEETIHKLSKIDDLFLKIGRLNRESFRTNRLPLLNLPEDILKVLREGELTYTKAKAIAQLELENRQQLVKIAIDENLSLSQIRTRVQAIKGIDNKKRGPTTLGFIDESKIVIEKEASSMQPQQVIHRKLIELATLSFKLNSNSEFDQNKQAKIEKLLFQIQEILES